MKKLSEQFIEMSQRTAAWETRTAAVNEQNRKEFEADVAEAQQAANSAQAAFAARLNKVGEKLAAPWREVHKNFSNQMATARRRAAEWKAADELAAAQDEADFTEGYAETAAEFARLAAAEADAAMLEAKAARAYAKDLEKVPPPPAVSSQKTPV